MSLIIRDKAVVEEEKLNLEIGVRNYVARKIKKASDARKIEIKHMGEGEAPEKGLSKYVISKSAVQDQARPSDGSINKLRKFIPAEVRLLVCFTPQPLPTVECTCSCTPGMRIHNMHHWS
jgi:hypothetical protein